MPGTSRSRELRIRLGHFEKYLNGSGIDVGCGSDPLVVPNGSVIPWDVKDGDGAVLKSIPNQTLDFVYSSHCLEHLPFPQVAIANWRRVLKRGGFLFVVVPDWEIYEKKLWPSVHNPGHKHSFSMTITREEVGRDRHWHIQNNLVPFFDRSNVELLDVALEDDGYDYTDLVSDQTLNDKALSQIRIIGRRR